MSTILLVFSLCNFGVVFNYASEIYWENQKTFQIKNRLDTMCYYNITYNIIYLTLLHKHFLKNTKNINNNNNNNELTHHCKTNIFFSHNTCYC